MSQSGIHAYHRSSYPYSQPFPLSFHTFREQAVPAHMHSIHIIHPLLPWEIIVQRHNLTGIRIIDILRAIYSVLHMVLNQQDVDNKTVSRDHKTRILVQTAVRTGAGALRHAKKMDFLEGRFSFAGLEYLGKNDFQLKTDFCGGRCA